MQSNTQRLLELQGMARVLHNVFQHYPTAELIQYLTENDVVSVWPDPLQSKLNIDGKSMLSHYFGEWSPEKLDELKLDYGQLFFGPGEPTAMPWGSVYLDEKQLINDKSTVALMDFYKHHQVEFDLPFNQPVDHIGLFFAVIDQMLESIAQSDSPQHLIEILTVLLQQHMLPWSGRCLALAKTHAETEFYEGFACLAEDFQDALVKEFNIIVEPVKLFR